MRVGVGLVIFTLIYPFSFFSSPEPKAPGEAYNTGRLRRPSVVVPQFQTTSLKLLGGWSGGAKLLGKLPVPGRPTIWITVGQGPTALAVGAGGGCLDIFTLIYPFFPLSPSLWETARYRLKYCLKGPLNPKQPTNHLKLLGRLQPHFIYSLQGL